jgi:tetratricopeptide (TPR) repeat protein
MRPKIKSPEDHAQWQKAFTQAQDLALAGNSIHISPQTIEQASPQVYDYTGIKAFYSAILERTLSPNFEGIYERIAAYIGLIQLAALHSKDNGQDKQGQIYTVREYIFQLEQLLSRIEDESESLKIFNTLAYHYINRNEFQFAETYLAKARAIRQNFRTSHPLLYLRTILIEVIYNRASGNIAEAHWLLKHFFEVADTINVPANNDYAIARYELASVLYYEKKYEEALSEYKRALVPLEKLNLTVFLAMSHHSTGLALATLGDYKGSEKPFEEALKYWTIIGAEYEVANVYATMGYFRKQAGDNISDFFLERALWHIDRVPPSEKREALKQEIKEMMGGN